MTILPHQRPRLRVGGAIYRPSLCFSCSGRGQYCFVWVSNLVVDTAGGKKAEGVGEQGVEENIWT